ncbi:hypothetical protein [Meiothermus hypogaeus]|uniref:Uncharacterized protein n=2 Tax=Meiothermus hypogaeus TaxID=884155 RepID=A0A511R2E7_9DEIN|nr:hypothetical protein [Meiothermus hypogaeus]RIH74883.1 hypothetical protein Mhypo_03141 [Meiothermus hypogaeus]GEM83790.1 hypothetical protein MHY01S_19560 [Meiothermus hypogaeus NBRC 106114]GIW36236.1 MAG: hypothetical protein KatS3mg073_0381 [Meiothermus sp.]
MAGLSNIDPKVVRLQIELLRQSSPARRLPIMASLSATAIGFLHQTLTQKLGNACLARIKWMRLHYGAVLAEQLREKSGP